MNLQQDTEKTYDACPYCLTKIVQEYEPIFATDEPEETFEREETERIEAETEVEKAVNAEERVETPEAPSGCLHHLGYLSEKSSKEQIPDECMMCKDIVSCMLKKMKE